MEAGTKKWDLISLASIPLIMTLGNSMLLPVLPAIRAKLHVTSFQVSLLITVYSIVAILLIPVAGYLSDRYGRKRIIIPSLAVAGIGGALSGIVPLLAREHVFLFILLGRFIQGIGAAGAAPIVLPLVSDMFTFDREVNKGLGLIETGNTLGKVLSPILGSALAAVLWFLPFLTIPVLCAISILLVAFLVETPKTRDKPTPQFRVFAASIIALLRQKGRWMAAVFAVGAVSMFVVFATLFYLSTVLEETYGIHGIWKGVVLAIPLSAFCLSSYLTGKFVGYRKNGMKWISFGGLALLSVSVMCCALTGSLTLLLLWHFCAGIGMGLALPCLDSFITTGIDKAQRGTISSIYSSMRFVGVAAGPPAASLLMRASPQALFMTLGGVCGCSALITLLFIRPRKELPAAPASAHE